jgi:hypothetical protein
MRTSKASAAVSSGPARRLIVPARARITLLQCARDHWSGTLICIFQPAEENLDGAQAMLDDGLYDKIPKPELVRMTIAAPMTIGSIVVCGADP